MNPHPPTAYVIRPNEDARPLNYRVTLLGSWIGDSETVAGANALIRAHRMTSWGRTLISHRNPIVREITHPGRMDGCRTFERLDGIWLTYDPAILSIHQWEAATGVPFPLHPVNGLPPAPAPLPPVIPASTDAPRVVDPEILARRFKHAREATGLSMAKASAKAGLAPATVRMLETCGTSPSLLVLTSVAGAYGLTLSDVIRQSEH